MKHWCIGVPLSSWTVYSSQGWVFTPGGAYEHVPLKASLAREL